MRCPQCQPKNRDGAKFCSACGAKLDLSCPSCGTVKELGAAFCDHCGTALIGRPKANRGRRQKAKREKAVAHPQHPISYTPDIWPNAFVRNKQR